MIPRRAAIAGAESGAASLYCQALEIHHEPGGSDGRQPMRSDRRLVAVAAVAALLAFDHGTAAMAREPASPAWAVRGFGAWVSTRADPIQLRSIDPLPPVIDARFTLDDGAGGGLALEYRATRRIGIEAFVIQSDLDAEYRLRVLDPPTPEAVATGDVASDLYGAGLLVHLTPGRRIDVYVGPLAARVRYGHFHSELGGLAFQLDLDDDTAYGVTLGADLAMGRTGAWAVTAALRQLWSSSGRSGSVFQFDVDPLIACAGVAYRWGGG